MLRQHLTMRVMLGVYLVMTSLHLMHFVLQIFTAQLPCASAWRRNFLNCSSSGKWWFRAKCRLSPPPLPPRL